MVDFLKRLVVAPVLLVFWYWTPAWADRLCNRLIKWADPTL